jgi:hypothetical protein
VRSCTTIGSENAWFINDGDSSSGHAASNWEKDNSLWVGGACPEKPLGYLARGAPGLIPALIEAKWHRRSTERCAQAIFLYLERSTLVIPWE